MKNGLYCLFCLFLISHLSAQTGVGVTPPVGADHLFDGSRASLDQNWTYWEDHGWLKSYLSNGK